MRRRGLRTGIALAVAGLALVTAACGSGGGASTGGTSAATEVFAPTGDPLAPKPLAQKETVTVGIGKQLEVYAQFMLADAEGEFAKENLEVVAQDIPETDKMPLLAQGRLDLGFVAMTAGLLNSMGSDTGVKWAFPGSAYGPESFQGYWFSKAAFPNGVKASEMRGKTILTPSGNASISAYYLWQWIQKNDPTVKFEDLKFQVMKPTEIAVAMSNGAADVAQVTSPGSSLLQNDPCCEFVDTGFPRTALIGYVGSKDFLDDRPEVAMAFFRAIARTQREYLQPGYHQNADVAAKLAQQMGQPVEKVQALPELLFDPAFPIGVEHLAAQQYWRDLGLLKYPTNLTEQQVFDTRFVDTLTRSPTT
ncbi:ABC transporter substrate-binding protein [Pseudonocardia pini]|uniref:ABC transporter substrate-binding protein n=1 Tax=Pseudonocardia pini TaxID=2758030 RepID=UPI0015F0FF17|nr:ABC transporter substrate-binding protein [Pseudonocardia pini]